MTASIKFFSYYLSNRQQYVALRGHTSESYAATSGVPQDSVLGPLIFNIFVNDIGSKLDVQFLMYADDIKIYRRIKHEKDYLVLQRNLNVMNAWCVANNL